MDQKLWPPYALLLSVCFVTLAFPLLLLGCVTTVPILKPLWRSCLSLFLRTHKPYLSEYAGLTNFSMHCTISTVICCSTKKRRYVANEAEIPLISICAAVFMLNLTS